MINVTQEENIYNILPAKKILQTRPAYYKSRYPYDIPPTSSTFILNGSSLPGISNCNGDYKLPFPAHSVQKQNSTFGLPKGSYAANPKFFHKKGKNLKILPPLQKFNIFCKIRKPQVPTLNDRPIQIRRGRKNYVLSNALDNILMEPRNLKNMSCDNIMHKNYGKVPDYIMKFKKEKEEELSKRQEVKKRILEEENLKRKILSEGELNLLREGLKKKWKFYNNKYGNLSHKKVFDNIVLLRK